MPIQLKFTPRSRSIVALEDGLLRRNKITSLTVYSDINPMLPSHQLLTHSKPSMEQLHIYADRWRAGESAAHEIWPGFPSLREICLPIHHSYQSPLCSEPRAPGSGTMVQSHRQIDFGYASRLSPIGNPHHPLERLPGPNSRSLLSLFHTYAASSWARLRFNPG